MLEIKDVSIRLLKNDRPLIDNFSFTLNKGDKIAIIGEEGNGKSSLLKFIYDSDLIKDYCLFKGNVLKKDLKVGYLRQILDDTWNRTKLTDFFLKDNPSDEIDYSKYNEMDQILKVLSKINVNLNIVEDDRTINTLSGGEKVKVQIAKILSNNPDILLLDEPTNDLDIKTLEWLEDFIINTDIPIMFVSHDETLLENISTGIIHIEQLKKKKEARHIIESLNYKKYIELRMNKKIKQDQISSYEHKEYKDEKKTLKDLKNKVSQVNPERTNRMNSLLSQEKRLEEKELTQKYEIEEVVNIKVDNDVFLPNNKKVIDLELDELKIGDKTLSKNIKLQVSGPKKIGIVGTNGVGKTTLINEVYNYLKDSDSLNIGYMPQDYSKLINMETTTIKFLSYDTSKEELTKVSSFLGSMKFTSDEMNSKIKNLSGGQLAKLYILKLILFKCNVLILDEPTRNLSPLTNPAIRSLLKDFKGSIISVSHDRKFLDEVCDDVYELNENGFLLTN